MKTRDRMPSACTDSNIGEGTLLQKTWNHSVLGIAVAMSSLRSQTLTTVLDEEHHGTNNLCTLSLHICRSFLHCPVDKGANLSSTRIRTCHPMLRGSERHKQNNESSCLKGQGKDEKCPSSMRP